MRTSQRRTPPSRDGKSQAVAREKQRIEPEKPQGIAPDDEVDQASYDSFPASDPPAHSARQAVPGGKPSRKPGERT